MARNWTPAQRQAIDLRGQDILVSAAAGSGKTAVLTQRIIERITDPVDPVSVDELLDDGEGPVTKLTETQGTKGKLLKIRAIDGVNKVNVNLPVALIEVLLMSQNIQGQISIGKTKAFQLVDFQQIMDLISLGVMGKLVEAQGEDGEIVEVWVEMKILIHHKKIHLKILLPMKFSLKWIGWAIRRDMNAQQKKNAKVMMKKATRIIKDYKKENGAITLLEVEEEGKEIVKIII